MIQTRTRTSLQRVVLREKMEPLKRCYCQKTPFHHSPTSPFPTSAMLAAPQAVMVAAFNSQVGLSCLMNSSWASLYESWSGVCLCYSTVCLLVFFVSYLCFLCHILMWVSVQRCSYRVLLFFFRFECKCMLLCINTIHQTLVNIYNFYINFAGLDSPCFVSQDSNCSLQTHKGGQVLSKS